MNRQGNFFLGLLALFVFSFVLNGFEHTKAQSKDHLIIYVSPSGSDENPGSIDSPLATIQAAFKKTKQQREREKTGIPPSDIILREGTYQITETLHLWSDHSNIQISSYKNEQVTFSGGVTIPNDHIREIQWPLKDQSDQATAYRVDLKKAGIHDFGKLRNVGFARPYGPSWGEVFINKKPMHLARWPNKGMVPMGKVLHKGSVPREEDFSNRGGVIKYDSARIDRWADEEDAWMSGYFMWGYADDMVKIASIDTAKKTITTSGPTLYGFGSGEPWRQWYGVNISAELDIPGEYYIDREEGVLYFITDEKEISSLEFSILENPFISLNGAENVTINGITFETSRGLGIALVNTQKVTIKNCVFRNLGSLGITVGKGIKPFSNYRHEGTGESKAGIVGSLQQHLYANTTFNRKAGKNNKITGSEFYQLGAGGVSLGGGNRRTLEAGNNVVENNVFHDLNRIEKSYRPAVHLTGVGNKVTHNEIYNLPSMAILMHGNNHLIEYNYIHDVVLEVDDQGALYYGRDPSERGTIIRYNYFENIPDRFRTSAIYQDDGAGGLTVTGNVFYKAGKRNVLLGGGSDNTYRNNIFISYKIGIYVDNRLQNWAKRLLEDGGLFEQRLNAINYKKPPYSKQYPSLASYWENAAVPSGNLIEGNAFVRGEQVIGGKKKGLDFKGNNWITDQDPGFADWESRDFSLGPNAVVFKRIPSFKAIPFNKIGRYEMPDEQKQQEMRKRE